VLRNDSPSHNATVHVGSTHYVPIFKREGTFRFLDLPAGQ
jgi:hypothetical protein